MSKDLKTASPREMRALIRAGEITSPPAWPRAMRRPIW